VDKKTEIMQRVLKNAVKYPFCLNIQGVTGCIERTSRDVFFIHVFVCVTVGRLKAKYRYAPHNDVSVNDRPHIRQWSHKIIIL